MAAMLVAMMLQSQPQMVLSYHLSNQPNDLIIQIIIDKIIITNRKRHSMAMLMVNHHISKDTTSIKIIREISKVDQMIDIMTVNNNNQTLNCQALFQALTQSICQIK